LPASPDAYHGSLHVSPLCASGAWATCWASAACLGPYSPWQGGGDRDSVGNAEVTGKSLPTSSVHRRCVEHSLDAGQKGVAVAEREELGVVGAEDLVPDPTAAITVAVPGVG